MERFESLRRWLGSVGPYLVVEVLVPGGTLLALLLYLYRRGYSGAGLPLRGATARAPFFARGGGSPG